MQYVVVNGVSSKPLSACHFQCAPGFCPARPSFLIGIAELPLSPESKLVMYADNILLCRPNRQASDYQHLQQDVEALGKWANNNHLSFSPSKLKPMVFSRKIHPVSAPSYFSLNESRLEIVDSFVYLGITISSNLYLSEQIQTGEQHFGKRRGKISITIFATVVTPD